MPSLEPSLEPTTTTAPAPSPTRVEPKAPTATEAPPPALGKIALEVAKDIAQDLASDYIPREKQPQALAFLLGALAMLFFVILVRLVQRD
jgi:hypothetical protein